MVMWFVITIFMARDNGIKIEVRNARIKHFQKMIWLGLIWTLLVWVVNDNKLHVSMIPGFISLWMLHWLVFDFSLKLWRNTHRHPDVQIPLTYVGRSFILDKPFAWVDDMMFLKTGYHGYGFWLRIVIKIAVLILAVINFHNSYPADQMPWNK